MKIQKFALFVKKNLKINIQDMENTRKVEIIAIIQMKIKLLHKAHVT